MLKIHPQSQELIELIQSGMPWTRARKQLRIGYDAARKILADNNIQIPSRKDSAKAKRLSAEEILSRLPETEIGTKFLGYDENNDCRFETVDGYQYIKYLGKVWQGDPRKKSGTLLEIDEIRERLKVLGYELISTSYQKKKPLEAKHIICGHIRSARLGQYHIKGCKYCSNTGVSKEEIALRDWIESLGITTSKFAFPERVTKPQELDVVIEHLKIGFEYCGIYFHNENSPHPRLKDYHYSKMLNAQKYGYRLITIFSDEWLSRTVQVKGFIKSILGVTHAKYFARDCTVKTIEPFTANTFLEDHHIQGASRAIIFIGLYHGNELVGVMTGSSHHRQNTKEGLVLSRMCFKDGIQVIGGASKLLSLLMYEATLLGYREIISWSDNRWSEGKVYETMGFIQEEELAPDYSYTRQGKRFSKQSLKKRDDEKGLGKTELELRNAQGFSRIWDCGKKRWILKL